MNFCIDGNAKLLVEGLSLVSSSLPLFLPLVEESWRFSFSLRLIWSFLLIETPFSFSLDASQKTAAEPYLLAGAIWVLDASFDDGATWVGLAIFFSLRLPGAFFAELIWLLEFVLLMERCFGWGALSFRVLEEREPLSRWRQGLLFDSSDFCAVLIPNLLRHVLFFSLSFWNVLSMRMMLEGTKVDVAW